MRNPFARLATRDAARPSLRDRAAALKASASRVIRRKAVDAASAAPVAAAVSAADPILAAIAETRRLMTARVHAAALPQPAGSIDPLPEQEAAADAFNTHVDDVLLKTVPTTAAGCVALARYAVEFLGDEGFALDEDQANEQHVRILDLIARSPMLDKAPPLPPFVADFSAMTVADLRRTYDAFKLATDIMGLTGHALPVEGGGANLLDAEGDRLSFFQGFIADELQRRDVDRSDTWASWRIDTLINRAVACGDYEEAARLAAEADAKGL
jgi:hypothetical protein